MSLNIIKYAKKIWQLKDTVVDSDVNKWENQLQSISLFIDRYCWKPQMRIKKGATLLFPFGINEKMVALNDGVTGSVEPTWQSYDKKSMTIRDNNITWQIITPYEFKQPAVVPIGTIIQEPWTSAPEKFVDLSNGPLLSRTEFPECWAFVNKYCAKVSESEWQRRAQTQTSVGVFSLGDGLTTFRCPKLLDFIRAGNTSSLGEYYTSQNKEHSHTRGTMNITGYTAVSNDFQYYPSVFEGAFSYEGQRSDAWCANDRDGRTVSKIKFNAADTWTGSTSENGGIEAFPTHIVWPYFLKVSE